MLLTFALILLLGMAAGRLCAAVRLPPLMGMLLVGVALGPSCLNWIDPSVLGISPQIRRIALIIILIRAGLNLKTEDLKRVGRPAILLCFLPAVFEMAGMTLLAPLFFPLSRLEALVLGTVIAAVSPAVIVPHMLRIMEEGYGSDQGIPQMILAGASGDDIFVIVLFTSFVELAAGGAFQALNLLRIPSSILLGIAGGVVAGYVLHWLLRLLRMDGVKPHLVFLSAAFLLMTAEDALTGAIGFSGLIAVMAMGMTFAKRSPEQGAALSAGFSKLWTAAELFLFVLVGAAVDLPYAAHSGGTAVLLVLSVLLFRMLGVAVCVAGTALNRRERLFCMLAYTPKATVQAAIGAIPLSMGLAAGNTILTVAVVAILVTAPLGAFLIDFSYRRWLRAGERTNTHCEG